MSGHDGLVLLGGRARRLGGISKAEITLAGKSLLDLSLDALSGAGRVIAVGSEVRLPSGAGSGAVLWAREEPPGGGPAAALAAALPLSEQPVVVVLAVDYPFAGSAISRLLITLAESPPEVDGAVLVDGEGRQQTLLAAYRRHALVEAVQRRQPALEGCPVKVLLEGFRLVGVPAEGNETLDIDTPEDLTRARSIFETP